MLFPNGVWCWAAGPVLSEEQLTLWCQDQDGLDAKLLANLGPFDYAHRFMGEHRYSPDLLVLYDPEGKPSVLFMCTAVFTSVGVKPPDLSPTPETFKTMRDWVRTKNVSLEKLPYMKIRWPDNKPFPPRLRKAFEEEKEKLEKEKLEKKKLEKSTREASHSES